MPHETIETSLISPLHLASRHPCAPFRAAEVGHELFLREVHRLAKDGLTAHPPGNSRLLARFQSNQRRISHVCKQLAGLSHAGRSVPAASEWLLDNKYIMDGVVHEIQIDLPGTYYRELPALQDGHFHGYPRIYELAVTLLSYTDSSLSETVLREVIDEYQRSSPLTIGELWAVPTMLRLGLLDNLRRLADHIMSQVNDHRRAALAIESAVSGHLPTLPAVPSDSYALALWESLRQNDPPQGPIGNRLHEWSDAHLQGIQQIQHREFCLQAADQVSIGNAITSLRLLGIINWADYFESTSLVERILRNDPVYPQQDFATRDRCRRAIERLSRGSRQPETSVARAALTEAQLGASDTARGQVSYFLLDEGRHDLGEKLAYQPNWADARLEWLLHHPNLVYFGLLVLFLGAGALATLLWATSGGIGLALAVVLLALVPISEIVIMLVNQVVCRIVPPRTLPRLEFKQGIPQEHATFVVIPALIANPMQAAELLERLEQHYLANPDSHLWYALLSDFTDSHSQTRADDDQCVHALLEGVKRLNRQHANLERPLFFAFHRHRLFNTAQKCWMGWERKRGKLEEFNRLLRGAQDTSFSTISSSLKSVPSIRYVLTLDADTVLPRDAARQMIATLAHPLNRPKLSSNGRFVKSGYGLLQPRISFLYQTGFTSWFARLFTNSAGIDPYSSAVSDTYMDLFGRGTFTGKGLYEVDAFASTAGQAFPQNHILSHDLIESNYARCALATDIEVFDGFPANYHTYAKREHRWIRGDWQLTPWLRRTVPIPTGRAINGLPALAHWKIIDNLRRSLVAPAVFVLLLLSWTLYEGALGWTLLALSPWLLPSLIQAAGSILTSLRRQSILTVFSRRRVPTDFISTLGQGGLQIAFLLNHALVCLDAILRTAYRLLWSRRNLLEWETAAAADKRYQGHLLQSLDLMWPSMIMSVTIFGLVAMSIPLNLLIALPFLVVWLLAPWIAYIVSQPRMPSEKPLTSAERAALRFVARKTWHFFETFVGSDDHWLPPDNYQEDPLGIVAHRTSPTNIGVYLLSVLSAHDFGYITTGQMIERVRSALDTLDQLERHRGHFLNWYDTSTLAPLHPAYVSTVDSGNLLACFLALKHGLLSKVNSVPVSRTVLAGLRDTLAVFSFERNQWAARGTGSATLLSDSLTHPLRDLSVAVDRSATADELAKLAEVLASRASAAGVPGELAQWAEKILAMCQAREVEMHDEVGRWRKPLQSLADRADRFAADMDFRFLYNADRSLFSIGFNVDLGRLDANHYDLLASEANIASFLAVARGDVPRKHWFQLGRLITRVAGQTGLVSWGGTMFEYLMPRLILSVPPGVLLDQAQRAAVRRQIEYGRETGLPWGMSESAYYAFDVGQSYQYQSFGVPGLGLKRGLNRDRVVAPYATLLAVDVMPQAALANLARLRNAGALGPYGFYEAIDFTPERMPAGVTSKVIKTYMAHHHGMGLLAIANRMHARTIAGWLRAEPAVRSAELLLEERIPHDAPPFAPDTPEVESDRLVVPKVLSRRRIATAETAMPRTHVLSNGCYTVMLTNAGGGFSRRSGLDITRWPGDPTMDCHGQFIYLRDRRNGRIWSAAHQPTGRHADEYEVIFALDKADFRRVDGDIESLTEITVVPDADIEVRRITLINQGRRSRYLDVTSYSEIVLAPHSADAAHPAFSKLFLETEWLSRYSALVCRRRPRSSDQPPVWAVHVLADDDAPGTVSFETDRGQFLGRRRTPVHPAALDPTCHHLSGTAGAVLDPIFSLRKTIKLRAGERIVLGFTTGFAESREAVLALADRYHSLAAVNRGFELAWAHARIELQHSRIRPEDIHLFQRLAGHLFYPVGPLRSSPDVLSSNKLGQSGLWGYGVSGDLPITLLRLHGPGGISHLRQLLQAHEYWRSKTLQVDLMILCENAGGYFDSAYTEAINTIRTAGHGDWLDRPGGIFVRKGGQMPDADRTLLLSVARVVIDDRVGPLSIQGSNVISYRRPARVDRPLRKCQPTVGVLKQSGPARFLNGFGGFSEDEQEYIISPNQGDRISPAPWSNVIANPNAGFLVTDSGGGFFWAGNSQLNRLTPWSNDPVSDPPGEVIYLQDAQTGATWCPTPLPIHDDGAVTVSHGQGYTSFQRSVNDITHDLTVAMPQSDAVKLSLLRLKNTGTHPAHLLVTYYVDWVLGTNRTTTAQHVITSFDSVTRKAIFARNPFHPDCPQAVAFAATCLDSVTVTANRTEFIGRNRSLAAPAGLEQHDFSGQVGAGLDPCAALRGRVMLAPGEESVLVFLLGQAPTEDSARETIARYLDPSAAEEGLEAMVTGWDETCSALEVKTPDSAFDLLMNRWLIYQVLSCRVWGRSAFYQSGGAYGFRDQLQDVMALVYSVPEIARSHILRAAARQFIEGDVQHWWHEPSGQGVRTRFSDDFLWLPFVVAHYVEVTADDAILEEIVPFLNGEPLPPDRHEIYRAAVVSEFQSSLYDHCVRALQHGWKLGPHGLPLMGGGDWNDGMNLIGVGGRGESVWVGWFQIVCLNQFAILAEKREDAAFATLCRSRAVQLHEAIEHNAYDGAWYRRAYFDDGTPLGSANNDECKIDSLAQSWAVLSGMADPDRAARAMEETLTRLVRHNDRLVLLFDPPFDHTPLEPGYIKGYPPGIRENGGQYTHAACWVVQALIRLGRHDQATRIFDLINPIRATSSEFKARKYCGEPYVIAADVYHHQQHKGRAGWTWYTGSAAWFYRIGLEEILGFRIRGDQLELHPAMPSHWPSYRIRFRYRQNTIYLIDVHNSNQADRVLILDGVAVHGGAIKLVDDGEQHHVELRRENHSALSA